LCPGRLSRHSKPFARPSSALASQGFKGEYIVVFSDKHAEYSNRGLMLGASKAGAQTALPAARAPRAGLGGLPPPRAVP